ncbi:MAG: MarR family transcriptional regulator [Myxococcota bacterium]
MVETRKRIAVLDDQPHYAAWIEVVKTYERCHRLMSVRFAKLGLSVAQHEVLLALGREEGLSQVALASRLLSAKSNVTALLKRLENASLIERRPDAHDGRSQRVFLTPDGRKLLRKSSKVQGEIVQLMTEGFEDEEAEALRRSMRRAGRSLARALDEHV